jgi:hypothetical protein
MSPRWGRHQDLLTDRELQCDFDSDLTYETVKDRLVLSSERAPHKNTTVTIKQ